jgi:primary-amine oxidase
VKGAPASARAADAIMFDWTSFVASRATVDLVRGTVAAVETLSVRHPPVTNLILFRADEAARSDPRWRAAIVAHGRNPDRVSAQPGALGEGDTLGIVDGTRRVLVGAYDRDAPPPEDNVAGITGVVDLTHAKMISVGNFPAAPQSRLDSTASKALATPRSRLTSPAIPKAFTRRGSEIRWQNWRLHAGYHPRRGLELYDIAWVERGRARPVLYRAGVSEMIAPYGDPAFIVWFPRDEGDVGLGHYSRSSVVPFADAPPGAELVDGVVHDDRGNPLPVPQAIAVYERDAGVLWRHAGRSRRARQLVVASMATVDNYDYVFEWAFGLDGTIEVDVRLTGVMNLRPTTPGDTAGGREEHYGHLVAPKIFAPNHQHFFSYRLDFDVDGAEHNAVVEMESTPDATGPENKQGLWFQMHERVLEREGEAQRTLDLSRGRRWKVISTTTKNSLGQSTGYALLPGENNVAMASTASPVVAKAGWIRSHVWVTPFEPAEMHAGGDYQRFDRPGDGLATWTRADRSVNDRDVVLWYTFGITHLPRPEDFPFMPAHKAGFRLVPSAFFGRNPALDAPVP